MENICTSDKWLNLESAKLLSPAQFILQKINTSKETLV